jgi:hypothetical protein
LLFQFKPGQSGNPGRRPEPRQPITEIYESILRAPAPIELCRAVGLPARSSFATVIAMALVHRAVYKTPAVKLLMRLTEGPLPTRERETEHIDYSAGLAAKELLIKKLERG